MRKSDYYAQNIGESSLKQFILHNYVMFFGKNLVNVLAKNHR